MKQTILFISILIISSCMPSLKKAQSNGECIFKRTDNWVSFDTIRGLILLPVEIDGIKKNFIFDNGATVSVLDAQNIKGKIKVSGAADSGSKMDFKKTEKIKIGEVVFLNTYTLLGDLSELTRQVPNLGGLIGLPIINKAHWIIDYENKKIQLSQKEKLDPSFKKISTTKTKDGLIYTPVDINNTRHNFVIDLGSSSSIGIQENSELAISLLAKYEFVEEHKETYTIGGSKMMTKKNMVIPSIKLSGILFENVNVSILKTSQNRIGIRLFENAELYIDHTNNNYKVRKQ